MAGLSCDYVTDSHFPHCLYFRCFTFLTFILCYVCLSCHILLLMACFIFFIPYNHFINSLVIEVFKNAIVSVCFYLL
jgi:hypothetical protein